MESKIPCIGHLSSEDILRASLLDERDFQGKKVLDIGCGFSGFLRHLRDKTQAHRLVGIDPVFRSDTSISDGISQTQSYIYQLLQTPEISEYAKNQLSSRLADTQKFSFPNEGIEYYAHISGAGIERFDYIFISFVYRHLSLMLKMQMDQEISSLLTQGGFVTVIDGMPELKELQRRIGNSKLHVGNPEHFEKSVSTLRIY